jgi:hypothetical protein
MSAPIEKSLQPTRGDALGSSGNRWLQKFVKGATLFQIALVSIALVGCSIGPPDVETRPSKYSSLITDWTPTGLVTNFPNPLPTNASNVKLSAFPGFLQGGAWFQVRFTLPAAEVSKDFDDASKIAKDFYDGGDKFTSCNAKKNGLPGTSFHTADNPKQWEFPADYRVFVFATQDAGGNPPFQSGTCYGVVISKQRNEVIYYAESW